jgi:hypothetical protein
LGCGLIADLEFRRWRSAGVATATAAATGKHATHHAQQQCAGYFCFHISLLEKVTFPVDYFDLPALPEKRQFFASKSISQGPNTNSESKRSKKLKPGPDHESVRRTMSPVIPLIHTAYCIRQGLALPFLKFPYACCQCESLLLFALIPCSLRKNGVVKMSGQVVLIFIYQ